MKKVFKFIVKQVKAFFSNWEVGTALGALNH